ncbi:hypothetical protein BV20DRAFT_974758 [Pilatotrama ljubarskyi]|nr:hypothetical protein BV20DRAFT_974758 [Pilatotrama ljubarskyi]
MSSWFRAVLQRVSGRLFPGFSPTKPRASELRLRHGSKTPSTATEPHGRPSARSHSLPVFTLGTLRAAKLTSDDLISLSEEHNAILVRFANRRPNAPEETTPAARILMHPTAKRALRPQHLQGFLYYWRPPRGVTPLAGEFRFRVTSDDDPSSWRLGKPYFVRHGLPWRLSLLKIAWRPSYEPLRRKLLEEGLVDEGTMNLAQELGQKYNLWRESKLIVHSFFQPFLIDLSQPIFTFYLLGRDTIRRCLVPNMMSIRQGGVDHPVRPFAGKLLCSFEPLWEYDAASDRYPRRVVMRVRQVIGSLTFADGYQGTRGLLPPSAGALVPTYRSSPGDGHVISKPWSVDIDVDLGYKEMELLFAQSPGERHLLRILSTLQINRVRRGEKLWAFREAPHDFLEIKGPTKSSTSSSHPPGPEGALDRTPGSLM